MRALAMLALLVVPGVALGDPAPPDGGPPAAVDEEDVPPPAPDAPPAAEAAPDAPSVPPDAVDGLVEAARAAYNAGRYNEAARKFLAAAQRAPRRAEIYRDLARARTWARNPGGAVVAYRIYLQLAPDAEDREKVEAELDLAVRQSPAPGPPDGPPHEAVEALEAVRPRALAGAFAGPDGALGAVDSAVEAGFIGPALADARALIAAELARQSAAALDRWWQSDARAEPGTLDRLEAGWTALRARRPLEPAEDDAAAAIAGLRRLAAGDAAGAIAALSPVAAGDPRLRYALAIALARAGRLEEALHSAETAARALDDPRADLLLGLLQARAGQPPTDALRRGLGLEEL